MNAEAPLDELFDLITARLGLGAQHLRRDKLAAALESLSASAGKAEAIASLRQLEFRSDRWQAVVAAATIPETRFLRQRGWFYQVEALALAPLINRRRRQGDRRLRIWSAGCASGEEAYTLAMIVCDLLPDLADWQVDILATDINADLLRIAEHGLYATRQLRELDPVQIARHFEAVGNKRYAVRPALRDMVRFQPANLAEDATRRALGTFDLILCRNVLIYLTPEMQQLVAGHLCAALRDGGWLAVAPAEALVHWFRPLAPVNAPEAILFNKTAAQPDARPITLPGAPCVNGFDFSAAVRPETPAGATDAPRHRARAPLALEDVRALADQGALTEAHVRCNELLRQDDLDGAAHLLLSAICSELGDFPTAYDAACRAIYLTPDSAEAHLQLAGVLRKLGRIARAERSMTTANRLAAARVAKTAAGSMAGTLGAGDGNDRR